MLPLTTWAVDSSSSSCSAEATKTIHSPFRSHQQQVLNNKNYETNPIQVFFNSILHCCCCLRTCKIISLFSRINLSHTSNAFYHGRAIYYRGSLPLIAFPLSSPDLSAFSLIYLHSSDYLVRGILCKATNFVQQIKPTIIHRSSLRLRRVIAVETQLSDEGDCKCHTRPKFTRHPHSIERRIINTREDVDS